MKKPKNQIWKDNLLDKIFYPKEPKGKEFIKHEILIVLSGFIDRLKSDRKFREEIIKLQVEKYESEKQWRKKLNGESINEHEAREIVESLTK